MEFTQPHHALENIKQADLKSVHSPPPSFTTIYDLLCNNPQLQKKALSTWLTLMLTLNEDTLVSQLNMLRNVCFIQTWCYFCSHFRAHRLLCDNWGSQIHLLYYGVLSHLCIQQGAIATWLISRYDKHHNYPSTSVRDRTGFLTFTRQAIQFTTRLV